jgi:hypothetical protein
MKIAPVVLACAALAAAPAFAQKPCGKADAAAAGKAVDRVVNYPALLKAWKDFGHCDSDAVADLFTDAILRLMVEWKDVETVALDMQGDPEYRKFIHSHLRSEMAKVDRPSIYSRAKASCPLTQGKFCEELIEVVKSPGARTDDLLAPLPTIPSPPAPRK